MLSKVRHPRSFARSGTGWQVVQREAVRHEARFQRVFIEAVKAANAQLDVEFLIHAIESGNRAMLDREINRGVAAFMTALGATYLPAVQDTLTDTGKALARSFNRANSSLRAAAGSGGVGADFSFTYTDPKAVSWAEQYAAKGLAGIQAETIAAIRGLVVQSLNEQLTAAQLARLITQTTGFGLTKGHMEAVMKFRQALLDNPGKIVRMGKKTKVRVPKWVTPGDEDSIAWADAKAAKYRDRLLRVRARNIARSSSIDSANEAQLQTWGQMKGKGYLLGNEKKEWLISMGACSEICAPMANQKRGLNEAFDTGDGRKILRPGAHGSCRCGMRMVFLDANPKSIARVIAGV